jgi:hypothetical protein
MLPDTENSDVGGVHDADEEPGNSGGVVGEVPGYVACCRTGGVLRVVILVGGQPGAGNGATGSAGRGHGQQLAAGQHVDPRP